MAKQSILQATDRFVNIAFDENPDISDFGEFKSALFSAFSTPRGRNAQGQFSDDVVIGFFESPEARKKIKDNVSDEEYKKLYGDGDVVFREAIAPRETITITRVKVQVKRYTTRKGTTAKSYSRGKGIKWTPVQRRFIQVRKAKKVSSRNIVKQYNEHFKKEQRTSSSIKTKLYRT